MNKSQLSSVSSQLKAMSKTQNGAKDDERQARFYTLGSCSDGVWYMLHLMAADGKYDCLETMIETLSRRFVCPKCIVHLREYIKIHQRPAIRTPWNYFKWTVDFHNSVNKRVNGKELTEEGAEKLFKELTSQIDQDREDFESGKKEDCDGCEKKEEDDDFMKRGGNSGKNNAVRFI